MNSENPKKDALAESDCDVAIVGGGPAGLSAAMLLGRSRRRVIVFDHGRPRNRMAEAVHGFLGMDGVSPGELREKGRADALRYGAKFVHEEVIEIEKTRSHGPTLFEVRTERAIHRARKVLLATGVIDRLPEIEHIRDFYGKTVHHCPYCDGWEHSEKRLVALGSGSSAVDLAMMLRNWSPRVTACSNGDAIDSADRKRLERNGIGARTERVESLGGDSGHLKEIHFVTGPALSCDALFLSADQCQRSNLAERLGCESDDDGLLPTHEKQRSTVRGLFIAGDACGEVQFAIVAAAEGAIAATGINQELLVEDFVP